MASSSAADPARSSTGSPGYSVYSPTWSQSPVSNATAGSRGASRSISAACSQAPIRRPSPRTWIGAPAVERRPRRRPARRPARRAARGARAAAAARLRSTLLGLPLPDRPAPPAPRRWRDRSASRCPPSRGRWRPGAPPRRRPRPSGESVRAVSASTYEDPWWRSAAASTSGVRPDAEIATTSVSRPPGDTAGCRGGLRVPRRDPRRAGGPRRPGRRTASCPCRPAARSAGRGRPAARPRMASPWARRTRGQLRGRRPGCRRRKRFDAVAALMRALRAPAASASPPAEPTARSAAPSRRTRTRRPPSPPRTRRAGRGPV